MLISLLKTNKLENMSFALYIETKVTKTKNQGVK